MSITELSRNEELAVGLTDDGIIVSYYAESPTNLSVEILDHCAEQIFRERDHLKCLVVVDVHSKPPQPEVRDAIQRTLQRYEAYTRALAYVVLAGGFRGATARAIVSGLLMLSRPKYPNKVFSEIPQAIHWLYDPSGKATGNPTVVLEVMRFCRAISASKQPGPNVARLSG